MHRFRETAWAKINLALHVRARLVDGYHAIESLFVFADDGDQLSAEAAPSLSLEITGPFSGTLTNDADNLVLRAAHALQDAFGVKKGAQLFLEKNIPVAAGLGGGSADAAAALRLLARLWDIDADHNEMLAIAATLGADVPACFESKSLRGEGRGDHLVPIDDGSLSGLPILLVNPRISLSTGPVFANWDGVDRGSLGQGDPMEIALQGRNDLEAPAFALVPEIDTLVSAIQDLPGVTLARMSGSGASCFGIFENEQTLHLGAQTLKARSPHYWLCETRLR